MYVNNRIILWVIFLLPFLLFLAAAEEGEYSAEATSSICAVLQNLKGLLELIPGGIAVLFILLWILSFIPAVIYLYFKKDSRNWIWNWLFRWVMGGLPLIIICLIIFLILVEVIFLVFTSGC